MKVKLQARESINVQRSLANNLLECEGDLLKYSPYQLIDVMTESEIKNKTGSPIESKWKLDKDLEFASGKAQASAKAWISLRKLANQPL